ncbi:MAG: glycosyltransferase family 1 protein [Leptolyngbyaceae cyanobacterium CSU_1_4]|nr:glycosyltransferase family 1 protein [Leptolyngbyaceae cyanobacterium CSU_1_4]
MTLNSEKWQALLNNPDLPADLEPLYEQCIVGEDIWCTQLYIYLKQQGLNVHLVKRPVPGKICIIPYHFLAAKHLPFRSYVVAIQTDSARPEMCEQRVTLNELGVLDKTDCAVPHLPHPILQPRDRSRGTKLENLDFKGGICNIAKPFLDSDFNQQLQALGIQFRFNSDNPERPIREWGDYRQTDVLIAVRNATFADLRVKPAIKLINAWLAGCPAILGPEPAYQMLRRSELDFFEVRNPQQAIAALKRLKEDPALYAAMVENGLQRAKEFTTEQQLLDWHRLLSGSIAQGYEQWLRQSIVQKLVGRPIQFVQRILEHKRQAKRYLYLRDNGDRLFDT